MKESKHPRTPVIVDEDQSSEMGSEVCMILLTLLMLLQALVFILVQEGDRQRQIFLLPEFIMAV